MMLIEHAADQGAAGPSGNVRVKRVLFEGDTAVGVEAQMQDGSARAVLRASHRRRDRTERDAVQQVSLARRDPKLKKAVLYSYFKGAHREPDLNGGATLVLRTPPGSGGWFWYIPLENDITSVGIVADPEYLVKDRGQDLAKIFHEEIEKV